jgi:hypothetical protein
MLLVGQSKGWHVAAASITGKGIPVLAPFKLVMKKEGAGPVVAAS